MEETPSSEFKIRWQDDEPVEPEAGPSPSNTGKSSGRREKAPKSGRGTLLLIFLLIVAAIALMVVGYIDIRERVAAVEGTRAKEAQNISEDLQSKFSSLSIKFSAMETAFAERADLLADLKKTADALSTQLSDIQGKISSLSTAKADKSAVDKALSAMEQQHATLSKKIDGTETAATARADKLAGKLAAAETAAAQALVDLKTLSVKLDALSAEKASKKELLAEINHIENVLSTEKGLAEKVAADLSQRLRRIELKLTGLETLIHRDAPPPAPAQPKAASPIPDRSSPGEVIEKDITR